MKESINYSSFQKKQKQKDLPNSALGYVLLALVPYTNPNLKLSFAPSLFFADLSRINTAKQRKSYQTGTIRNAFYRAKRAGYIIQDTKGIDITPKGYAALQPYKPKKLVDAKIMVIFDIPEPQRQKSRELRLLLRQLEFTQIQKSVWVTQYQSEKIVREFIEIRQLSDCVKLFECIELNT